MKPSNEAFLDAFLANKIDVIPIRGLTIDGKYFPKTPGYKNWSNPNLTRFSRQELLDSFALTGRWGVRLGSSSDNLYVYDIDLQKALCPVYDEHEAISSNLDDERAESNRVLKHTGICVEVAREWRKSHLEDFRKLGTLISLTPSGGVHIFFRSDKSNVRLANVGSRFIASILSLDSRLANPRKLETQIFSGDRHGGGQQVLLPPSKIPANIPNSISNPGSYFFLDWYPGKSMVIRRI